MKKITDFIVTKRYYFLILFIILTVLCGIISKKVNINYEISEYLPSDSETRIGLDIMENNFEELKSSTLNVMFKDLDETKKNEIYEELKVIDGVDSVDYDNSENYNKGEYTLYVINVSEKNDSKEAKDVYDSVIENYKDFEIQTSGDISTRNADVLPFYIIVIAVSSALVILIIMCESFAEPILFLIAILMGVVLNKGTNIIFNSVSNITDSICAILQMALSMDYSIMLMNRYRQECEKNENKVEAMKEALYNGLTSISSSSVTTVVGLIALVFMSFTIGKDLGFVLAKGVIFSLITIFFVLPGLILMFDKLIQKTKKKSPNFKLNKIGKLSYKFRYIAIPLFLGIFVLSFFLKGNLQYAFSNSGDNEVAKIFKEKNQMVAIYKTSDETKIAGYLEKIEQDEDVDEVLAYGNTINEKLKYNEINNKLVELDAENQIDDYILKIIYYNYFNQDENNKMTFKELVDFIKQDVYSNETLSLKIDDQIKHDVDKLELFVNPEMFNLNKNTTELASVLEIDKNNIDDLMIYYNSLNNNLTLSFPEFINFMNNNVLTNSKYSSNIDYLNREKLKTLSKFVSKTTIEKEMDSSELANLFGIDNSTVEDLFNYSKTFGVDNTKMNLQQFSNFVLDNLLSNPEYASSFDDSTIENIKMLKNFSNKELISKNMSAGEIANTFGVDENSVKALLLLKYQGTENLNKFTIKEFVTNVLKVKNNTHYLDGFDASGLEGLIANPVLMNDETKYSAEELSIMLGLEKEKINIIFNLIDFVDNNISSWTVTPNEFVKLILDNAENEAVKASLQPEMLQKLNLLYNIMINSETMFNYSELANNVGFDEEIIKKIYTLYTINITNVSFTPLEFVSFILEHKNDELLNGKLDNSLLNELSLLQNIMSEVVNNKKYNSTEISNLLGIDKNSVDLIYGLYITQKVNTNPTVSLYRFVQFLINDVITNPEYASNFDENSVQKLNSAKGIMDASINNIKYNKDEIFGILGKLGNNIDKNTIDVLYTYYGSINEFQEDWKLTLEEIVNFVNNDLIKDERFLDFITEDKKKEAEDGKVLISDAKKLLVGGEYSRFVLKTTYDMESDETSQFVQNLKDTLGKDVEEFYIIGDSPMAYEMAQTFDSELNFITILTMIFIFVVVMITFKSIIIPIILVLIIQSAVFVTMGLLSFSGESTYFIAILIVQSILMGATIDYAILYTSYYIEFRKKLKVQDAIINSYNNSMHTILTSASILIIVTLIVGKFASDIAAKVCITISIGTICSSILILAFLPAILAGLDKVIIKDKA